MKKQLALILAVASGLVSTVSPAAAFTNNRYLAYGKKLVIIPLQITPSYAINNSNISDLVTADVGKLVVEGLLKGQKGDKGDPGQSTAGSFGITQPYDGVAAPAPITYDSNIPGNIAGFTELSAGDFTAGTSLTVSPGAPVEISAGSSLEVDADANFTASTTLADLSVATIESPVSSANFDGYNWTNASSRELKENFAAVSPTGILSKIDSLPIYTWNYKNENSDVVHMGPVAEDFYSTFNLGNSSSSISTIDPAGVALAGIQGLDQKVNNLSASITTQSLEVGSPNQPTGVTIYDTVTKQPVCIFSANNILQSSPGQCAAIVTPPPQAAAIPDPPEQTLVPSSTLDSSNSTCASSLQDDIPDTPAPTNPSQPTSTIDSAAASTSTSTLLNN